VSDSTYTIHRIERLTARQHAACAALHELYGPLGGVHPPRGGRAWLATHPTDSIVGFATAERKGRVVYLTLCVVAPEHRGHGLQRRLLHSRLIWALAELEGVREVRTYTSADNWYSAANVVNAGFTVDRIETTDAALGGAFVHFRRSA
jgi:GNAT superfamily N-acetyltransferase